MSEAGTRQRQQEAEGVVFRHETSLPLNRGIAENVASENVSLSIFASKIENLTCSF